LCAHGFDTKSPALRGEIEVEADRGKNRNSPQPVVCMFPSQADFFQKIAMETPGRSGLSEFPVNARRWTAPDSKQFRGEHALSFRPGIPS